MKGLCPYCDDQEFHTKQMMCVQSLHKRLEEAVSRADDLFIELRSIGLAVTEALEIVDKKPSSPSEIIRWFSYEHLPPHMQEISKPICEMAHKYDRVLPNCAEKSEGLRKLLEAKDCLVRAGGDIKKEHFSQVITDAREKAAREIEERHLRAQKKAKQAQSVAKDGNLDATDGEMTKTI